MPKDKKGSKFTMKDMINAKPLVDSKPQREDKDYIQAFEFDESLASRIEDYNDRLLDLDETFMNLKPVSKILIRLEAKSLVRTEDGLILPNVEQIEIPTRAGMGTLTTVVNPYPFKRVGIVIAVPETYRGIDVGDRVILAKSMVEARAIGKGDEAAILMPSGFVHPDLSDDIASPVNPEDRNYGYVLVDTYDIQFKL